MVWRATDPQGGESMKIRFDLLPYCLGTGLDIGCGPEKLFEHFVGVDNLRDTKLFGISMKPDVVVPTCERLTLFAGESFDCVLSSHVLEHIEDYRSALAEWWRLVKVGGTLILYLPHRELYPNIGDEGANPDHRHDFEENDIRTAMQAVAGDWDLELNQRRDMRMEYSFLQVFRKLPAGAGQRESWQMVDPRPKVAVVRLGARGDALWAASLLPHLREQGYHITVITQEQGEEVLRHDPHIDRIIVASEKLFAGGMQLCGYFVWLGEQFDRVINLTGTAETRVLPNSDEVFFYWPDDQRRKVASSINYVEEMHRIADVPYVQSAQRFYPTADEKLTAARMRVAFKGPVVVIAATGSSIAKTWPPAHIMRFLNLLADAGVHGVVVGDIRTPDRTPPELGPVVRDGVAFAHFWGTRISVRDVLAFTLLADAVVGVETAVLNAVAMEPMPKIVMLSHSTPENLTRDWVNTLAVTPRALPCYPCHRIHRDMSFCTRDNATRAAACQAAATPELVAGEILNVLRIAEAA
jgi:ADP-heptose:LPS heptosyltransferase/predicted SAM-dependent methyltransferase